MQQASEEVRNASQNDLSPRGSPVCVGNRVCVPLIAHELVDRRVVGVEDARIDPVDSELPGDEENRVVRRQAGE